MELWWLRLLVLRLLFLDYKPLIGKHLVFVVDDFGRRSDKNAILFTRRTQRVLWCPLAIFWCLCDNFFLFNDEDQRLPSRLLLLQLIPSWNASLGIFWPYIICFTWLWEIRRRDLLHRFSDFIIFNLQSVDDCNFFFSVFVFYLRV